MFLVVNVIKSITFAQVFLNLIILHSHLLGLSHQILEKVKNTIMSMQPMITVQHCTECVFQNIHLACLSTFFGQPCCLPCFSVHFGKRPVSSSSSAALEAGWEDAALRVWR